VPRSFKDNAELTVRDLFRMREARGDVGIEIELEGTGPIGTPVRGWDVHEEGSLRNVGGEGRGGSEYVTHGAIALGGVVPLVERLNQSFEANGIAINHEAHRTSTHIHINAQNMKMVDVFGYVTVFTAVEPLLFHLCGAKRNGNAFCASSYETGDLPEYFHSFFKKLEKHRPDYGFEMWQRGKYASLSTFRLHDLGTLEARVFPHSVNPQEIHKWCTWLLKIREIVQNNQDKSFRNLIKEGIHNPITLAGEVFGYIPEVPANTIGELVSFGSQEAYELTRLLKRYLKKEPHRGKERETHQDCLCNGSQSTCTGPSSLGGRQLRGCPARVCPYGC
jgi:hypothetical protein